MTPDLDKLRELVELACARMARPADASELDQVLVALDAFFDALDRHADPSLIAVLVALDERMRAIEIPLELRDQPRRLVPGAKPVTVWARASSRFSSRLRDLRYDVIAARNRLACDCAVLVELGARMQMPSSTRMRSIGIDYDGYYNGEGYACDECGARWWHCTYGTESECVSAWEPRDPSWTPAT